MNLNYYDEILKNIEELYLNGDISKANMLIDDELNMPYIPSSFNEALNKLKEKYYQKDSIYKEFDNELIEDCLLNGDSFKQFIAIEKLSNLNIRNYQDIISKYLVSNGDENAKAYLISLMIEQGLNNEYKYLKNDIEYSFIPLYCERIDEMDGVICGYKFIDDSIGINNITIANMAKKLLAKVAFSYLPLSLDESEGLIYSKSIIIYLLELFEDDVQKDDFYSQFVAENDIILKRDELEEIVELLK